MDICSAESKDHERREHPITYYMNPLTCTSKFLYLTVLSFHFPVLRTLKRQINSIKQFFAKIDQINIALQNGDVTKIGTILDEA